MLVSDAINIKDAFIVNIGVNYEIIVRPNYAGRDVLLNCTTVLKDYFHTSKLNINRSTMSSWNGLSTKLLDPGI